MPRGVVKETFKIGSHTVEWWVESNGKFNCKDPQDTGARIQAPTLEALKKKARTAYKSLGKIEIPATLFEELDRWDNEEGERLDFEDVNLTGLHGTSDRVIYQNEHGEAQTFYGYSSSRFMRRLTEDERKQLSDAHMAVNVARKAYEQLKESFTVNAADLIQAELAKLTGGEEESDGD